MDPIYVKNLAETLSEVLPKAEVVHQVETGVSGYSIAHVAVPKASVLMEMKTDLEALLPNPRRTKTVATFSDHNSFLAYVERHSNDGTVTWCEFNPQDFKLKFMAVIDENVKGTAGWRAHRAAFEPAMSAEWTAWKGQDKKSMAQLTFAEWLQEHEEDINSQAEGMPTSLQMHKMATEFVANEERVLKSSVKLQSGGVRLTYIADPDAGTTEAMDMFAQFALGIPVFYGDQMASPLVARLKYTLNSGKVSFRYELVRADRVHKAAAEDLIATIRNGLGSVPLLMGSAT